MNYLELLLSITTPLTVACSQCHLRSDNTPVQNFTQDTNDIEKGTNSRAQKTFNIVQHNPVMVNSKGMPKK